MGEFDLGNNTEMKKIRKEVAAWTKQAFRRKRPPRVHIGTNILNDRKMWVGDDQRAIHMHVLGRSGQGKTYLLESMIRSDIDNGRGVCVIDPHGELYERTLRYCVRKRLDKRVILIDPSDTDWAVGLNGLEFNETVYDAASHASRVMIQIAKVFGGESPESMPRLQRWERNALVPLIRGKFTLVELFEFLELDEPMFRDAVMETEENPYVRKEWERFNRLRPFDKGLLIDSVLNRANKFVINDKIRRIFGQQYSTIDFRQAMDERKIILCNLNAGSLPDEEWKMLGVTIIEKMYQAGMSRNDIPDYKRKQMPPFYFYIDEFGELVSDDVAKALKDLRKFRVSLILSHQELNQLQEESPKLYSAVMAEPDIKVTFSISRDDGEVMAKSLFTGEIRGDIEKRVIEQTKFRPIETTRTVTTRSTGGGASYGSTNSRTSGTTMSYLPDSTLGSTSRISAENIGTTSTSSDSWSESTAEVPFYEYEEFMEVSSVQYYSIEEMVEKFVGWIVNQSPMHAQLKIGTRKPIPIVTPFVKDIQVREKDVEAFKERVYQQYARPVAEVDDEIERRVPQFLKLSEAARADALSHEEKQTIFSPVEETLIIDSEAVKVAQTVDQEPVEETQKVDEDIKNLLR